MVTITQVEPEHGGPSLGQECRFAASGESLAAVDYFLEHEGVFYPHALRAELDGSVRLFPESPGRYVLGAAWQSSSGGRGWARTTFQVKGTLGSVPQRAKTGSETLWVPSAWDAQLIATHEDHVLRNLEKIIRPGATVYDIGANVGLFSTRFARWIGSDGWLYAIEPNPICIYFLRANMADAASRNFTILPLAMSDSSSDCRFTLNYGSSLIGVGADSVVQGKPGHQIHVRGEALDSLIETLSLRKPDFIKLDVEGAEGSAVRGMMKTLGQFRPAFMIELHGRAAATEALGQLAPLEYQYLLSSTGTRYRTAQDLLDSLPEACVQVIGYP